MTGEGGESGASRSDRSGSLLTLHRLSLGYRILYSGVLLFILLGYGAGLARQELRAGLSPEGVAQWHLGNAGDPDATRLLFPASGAEILDRVWRRALGNGIPLLVLLALLYRSGAPAAVRAALGGATAIFALVDVAAPALTAALGAGFGGVALAAQVGVAAGATCVTLLCLRDMWGRPEAGPRFRERVRGRG